VKVEFNRRTTAEAAAPAAAVAIAIALAPTAARKTT